MKIRIITLAFLFVFSVFLCSCSSKTNKNIDSAQDTSYFKINNTNEYKVNLTLGAELNLKAPKGMAQLDDDILIADSGNDRLLLIDGDGALIKEIGTTGNGKGEFIKPVALAVDSNSNIYIADSGNARVQVLDDKGIFVKEFKVKDFEDSKFCEINDITVDNSGNIFVSTLPLKEKYACIYLIESSGTVKKIGEDLCGKFSRGGDKTFFISELEVISDKKGMRLSSGRNYVMELNSGNITSKFALPNKYTPIGINFCDNGFYILSGASKTIDRFDNNGNYERTVFQGIVKEDTGMAYMIMDKSGNIYISDWIKSVVYKLKKDS